MRFRLLTLLLVLTTLSGAPESLHARKLVIEAWRIEPSRSTTIITPSQIEDRAAVTVADLLREVPGIEIIKQGALGQTASVFMRGARAESTLVLIDGAEVNDVMSPGAAFDFSALSASRIERIEIYRGPQSVRFGAGALGGVINIITKGGAPGLQTRIELESGSYNSHKLSLGASGGSETLTTSFNYERASTDGFSASSSGSEKDGALVETYTSKTEWTPSETSRAELSIRHFNADVDLDQFGGPGGDDPNFKSRTLGWVAGLSGQQKLFEERWVTGLGFYFSELNRKTQNLPDASSTTDAWDLFLGWHKKVQWDNELIFDEHHRLLHQAQWRQESGHSHSEFAGLPASISKKSESVTGHSLTYLFESDTWFADLGLRADESSKNSNITSTRASLGRDFQETGTKISASYGTGFKLPSLYQLYSSYGDENLQPEKSSTYEVSWEQKLGPRLLGVITYFDSQFEELIDFNFLTNTYFNLAKASSRGVEAQVQVQVAESWHLTTWYTYLDAQDELTGLQLLRRPYQSGGAEVNYETSKWSGYLHYIHRGQRPDVNPATFARSSNDSYGLTHLGGGYDISESLKVRLRLENVFDKSYEEVLGYSAPRRSVFVQVQALTSSLL